MKNKCKDCGICCLDTSLIKILSLEDINLILRNYTSNKLRREDFIFRNRNGHFQLKNIENHCFFFNTISKTCGIYSIRPKGCRFYPLIYDFDKEECVFDKNCPRPNLFYQDNNDIERGCKEIKRFFEEQLFINVKAEKVKTIQKEEKPVSYNYMILKSLGISIEYIIIFIILFFFFYNFDLILKWFIRLFGGS